MLLFILLITYGSSWLTTSAVHDISCLDDGWSISYGDKTVTNVNLLNYQIGKTKKGDVITLKNTVFAKSPEYTLLFKSFLTSVDVYMDGRLLHSYGDDYLKDDGFVPKKYKNRYADLAKAFKDNWIAYYRHYLLHGIKEGRIGN